MYRTNDGTQLEVVVHDADRPRGVLVFIPSSLGDASSTAYRTPLKELLSAHFSVVLFNPRGHGGSEGVLSPRQAAQDLVDWLREQSPGASRLPVVGVGHSGGALCLLRTAIQHPVIKKLFLVAPILNTRESILYMYRTGNAEPFRQLMRNPEGDNKVLDQVLANPRWLNEEYWKENGLRQRLDYRAKGFKGITLESIGQLLENVFIPGHDVVSPLRHCGGMTEILLPMKDEWYPSAKTRRIAADIGIPVRTIEEASDHGLTNAWGAVWSHVMRALEREHAF
jgi:pimeloyl-ACP methyl ester carboxylesterase